MKVIFWKGKGLKKCMQMSQNAYIASRNVLNIYAGLFIYVKAIKKQSSLCPVSTNIIEDVISVLANTVTSTKLRAWYGVGFTSTRVT